MRFEIYLIEKTMSFQKALEIFQLEPDQLDKVKDTFRKLAMMNHPDRGGDPETFKEINNANEILKKAKSSPVAFGNNRDEWRKKWQKLGQQIKTVIINNFDPDIFGKYFGEFNGERFFHEFENIFPDENDSSPSTVGFKINWATKSRDTVFTLYVSTQLASIMNSTGLASPEMSFDLFTLAHGFHGNKKQKLSQSDYGWTNNHKMFTDPTIIFPRKKLEKIFKGETNKRAFKRRDMHAFLTQKLKAKTAGKDFYDIPLGIAEDGKEFKLTVWRSVFMRMATWMPNGIYKGHGRIDKLLGSHTSWLESEDTAKWFQELQKQTMRLKKPTDKQIINLVTQAIKTYNNKREAILKGVRG